jgi:pimeloyl-ACP methyl ester carboxylesterase
MPRFSPPIPPVLAALRFARGWGAPDPRRLETIETLHLPGRSAPIRALRIYPRGRDGGGRPDSRHPGWVVLHGITVTGLAHPSLLRFSRALASAGGHVLVPEIQSWTELDVATARTAGILEGAVAQLAQDPRVLPGGVLLAGFSFGGPQAIRVAASPELRGALRGVLSWGGYASMDAAIRFQFTGTHAEGVLRRPDPYGRWVLGANHLTGVPGCSAMHDVAAGLHELALRSGRYEFDDWDPAADALKAQLRSRLAPQHREIWDRFVTPADVSARQARGETPVAEGVEAFADAFAQVVRSRDPGLDPVPSVRRLEVPVRLLHGREDALIPWTETARLSQYLRPRAPSLETTITGLFAHSGTEGMGQPPPPPPLMRLEEGARLFQALVGVFRLR